MSRPLVPERPISPVLGMPSLSGLVHALSAIPKLEGAACKGHAPLFDLRSDDATETSAERRERHARAIELCRRCPARDACREWSEEIKPIQLHGVVAGRIRYTTPRKADTP